MAAEIVTRARRGICVKFSIRVVGCRNWLVIFVFKDGLFGPAKYTRQARFAKSQLGGAQRFTVANGTPLGARQNGCCVGGNNSVDLLKFLEGCRIGTAGEDDVSF
jgi:hypothetical protein